MSTKVPNNLLGELLQVPPAYHYSDKSPAKSQPDVLNECEMCPSDVGLWNSSPQVYNDESGLGDPYGTTLEIDLDRLEPLLPPDGGYGWFIVLGSFICMVLVDGVCFSYGIFLSELEATFGATKMQMTLAGSLLTGCYFMVGPFVGGLMNRFGSRKLVVIGTLLSSTSILVSSFAQNVNMFIVVFGVIGGIGYGMIYLPAATIVTAWFVKKRATVTGIIMAGSGIGVTMYSLALPHLISTFTWRGCILLLAAINLNCAVAGALFRPLSHDTSKRTLPHDEEYSDAAPAEIVGSGSTLSFQHGSKQFSVVQNGVRTAQDSHIKESAHRYMEGGETKKESKADVRIYGSQLSGKQINIDAHRRKSTTSWDDVIITHTNQLVPVPEGQPLTSAPSKDRIPMLSVEAINRIVEDVLSKQTLLSTSSLAVQDRPMPQQSSILGSQRLIRSTASQLGQLSVRPTDRAVIYAKSDNMGSTSFFASAVSLKAGCESQILNDDNVKGAIVKELRKELARPVHKKDLFLSGSIVHINEFLSTTDVHQYIRTVTAPADEGHTRNPFLSMLRNLFGVEILKSPTFLLLTASSIVTMIGYIVPYQFLKDNAQSYGYDEAQSSYLLAYLGIANTIGRVLAGWLSDRPWANVILVNNMSLVLSGIATALVPLMTTYSILLAYACFYGFVIAAFISVRTILIVEVIGLDRLTNAFGFLLLFQGMAIVAAPPLLGSLYDVFHDFGFTFILGGLAIFLSGVLCFPLSAVSRWENRRSGQKQEELEPSESVPRTGLSRVIRLLRDRISLYSIIRAKSQQKRKSSFVVVPETAYDARNVSV
ncbi:Solute carrier family 16 member 1 [Fasciola gigantica]|uniref:Solute carrier family 16 member 1 n=1 Tax=Fasciola gigantica TaxID=46835 RepID=A0A504YZL4_FASGI|nr:Solute carrier family 16 member 1 [Fasciola gigantica]